MITIKINSSSNNSNNKSSSSKSSSSRKEAETKAAMPSTTSSIKNGRKSATTAMGTLPHLLWLCDHHVHVEEGLLDLGPEALDHGVAEGEVGHEVAVHHVLEKRRGKLS